MFPMAAIYADGALRLANERLEGFRAESRRDRLQPVPAGDHPGRTQRIIATIRQAFGELDADTAAARLSDNPYRA